jgi:hypothetical protein
MSDLTQSPKPLVRDLTLMPDLKCSAVGGGDPRIADIMEEAREEARRQGLPLEGSTQRVPRDEAEHFRPPGVPGFAVDNG